MIDMPAPVSPEYQVAIDRFDVAIRAVLRLFRQRRWDLLGEVGITQQDHEEALTIGDLYVENFHSEQQVAALLARCPFVLSAALELLRRYAVLSAASRREWLKGNNSGEHLPHQHGGRGRGGTGGGRRHARARA